jgi:hypothetical protein
MTFTRSESTCVLHTPRSPVQGGINQSEGLLHVAILASEFEVCCDFSQGLQNPSKLALTSIN